MKKGDIVISPVSHEYLTKGKEYEVIDFWSTFFDEKYGHRFVIKGDKGEICDCFEKLCFHINRKNWILK